MRNKDAVETYDKEVVGSVILSVTRSTLYIIRKVKNSYLNK